MLALILAVGTIVALLDPTSEGEVTSNPESEQGYELIGQDFVRVFVEGVTVEALRSGEQRIGVHPREFAALAGRPATREIAVGEGIEPGDW